MMFIIIRSQESTDPQQPRLHTTMNWFRRTCNEIKIALYYWLYTMLIMQFTDLLIIHFFSFLCFLFFLLRPACFIVHENPPNKCAKIIRQNKWPARISCHSNLLDSPARITRRIYSPEKPAISTCGLLARDPPFHAQNPQARPGPPSLPPPPQTAPPTEPGGGGREPARPAHASWTGTFTFIPNFMNGYIFLYDMIHTDSTQSGLIWKYKYITVGEGIIC